VAAFPSDRFIIVRLEIQETQVQLALSPEYAASLAADLADAVSHRPPIPESHGLNP
jgi:hypothetical protein